MSILCIQDFYDAIILSVINANVVALIEHLAFSWNGKLLFSVSRTQCCPIFSFVIDASVKWVGKFLGRLDSQHNDILHYITQHKELIHDSQHTWNFAQMTLNVTTLCHHTECRYAECRIIIVVILNVIMLSVLMPFNVKTLGIIANKLQHSALCVVMLSIYAKCHICWVSWINPLFWVYLCWMSLWWVTLCSVLWHP
jgi:hypothetical protein